MHDVLESLATLRRTCTIVYRDEHDVTREMDDVIVDVFADSGVEYLTTRSGLRVRLDRVMSVDGIGVAGC